jgi:hypothetical protein
VIAPSPELLNELIATVLKIEAREARLFGLDAQARQQISSAPATFAQPVSDEELERQWDRRSDEQDAFMILLQKLQRRWVEPRAIETTVSPINPSSD